MVALAERLRLELDSSDRENLVGSQIIPDKSLPDISNNVGPVKHFLGTLLHSLKRVFSSASFGVFPIGPDKYGSFVI